MNDVIHKCSARVYPPRMVSGFPCHNRAKFCRSGHWFCGQHDPVSQEERRKKRGPTQYEREAARIQERVEFKEKLAAAFLELWKLHRPSDGILTERQTQMAELAARCERIVTKKEVPL